MCTLQALVLKRIITNMKSDSNEKLTFIFDNLKHEYFNIQSGVLRS